MAPPKKKTSKKLLARLNVNYRLNILKEASYETQYSFSANLLKFILFSIILFFIVGVGFWCLFAYTGLRNHIPGYPHEEIRANDIENRQKADSLSEFMSANDLYYKNLKAILAGEKVEEVQFNPSTGAAKSGTLNYEISPVDSAAREQVSQENQFDIQKPSSQQRFLEQELLFKPTEGVISAGVNIRTGHFGIDISAPADAHVKAVLPGTVVFSGFSAGGGNEVHIQHDYQLISIYKHNSALLKKTGEVVQAGESIAIVGNSGEHSDGTHLHFEMWQKGVPLDPMDFFSF